MASISKRVSGAWQNTSYGIRATATDTITTLPTTIYGDGTNATVSVYGNTIQNGTPTPDSPIMPQGTGERTGNLFDSSSITLVPVSTSATRSGTNLGILPQGDYVFSATATVGATQLYRTIKNGDNYTFETIRELPYTFTADGTSEQIIRTSGSNFTSWDSSGYTNIMLNLGSTALPYEPYGYKIQISSNSTTTNIYLGEVETTRKIKKLVLTGAEEYMQYAGGTGVGICLTVDNMRIPSSVTQRVEGYCTHFVPTTTPSGAIGDNITFGTSSNIIYIILSVASQQALNVSNFDDFKSWLAAQYAAGTPVTVWYVLANEETAVVNEPLMRIGNYADEVSGVSIPTTDGVNALSVDTTVQPSEVDINYHGWHMGTVHERSSDQWD